MRRFRWMVAHDGLDILQPDLFYFGGLIRTVKVARMAAAAGKLCTPHMSGWGLGMLYQLHYASVVPNAGAYQEYKGVNAAIPLESSVSLRAEDGQMKVPTGPGSIKNPGAMPGYFLFIFRVPAAPTVFWALED